MLSRSFVVALALLVLPGAGCTKPYTAPPLGPTPAYVAPTVAPTPAPTTTVLPLIVNLTIGPSSPTVGDDAAFMAAVNSPMTAPITYAWIFGDGGTRSTSGDMTFYRFARSGTYQGVVHVTDATGLTGSGTAAIAVRGKPPTTPTTPAPTQPGLIGSLSCTPSAAGTPTTCNLSARYHDAPVPSAQIGTVAWDWGDGQTTSGPPTKAYTYFSPGTYTVIAATTVTVTAGTTPQPMTVSKTIVLP